MKSTSDRLLKMAFSRRRAAEDKNTKHLRELASLPANKQCFDCLQRGPTYINVTIGSFVCTTCSGILRGLTPPHRVKSISMTTFTPEEIEYLKSKGNEYCKYVWLGTFDTSTNSIESEVSDDQRKRDFMIQKYEKKRWYVEPDIAVKKMQNDVSLRPKQALAQSQNLSTRSNIVETQPLSRLLGKSPTPLVVQNNQNTETWPHPVSSASAPTISTKTAAQNNGSRSIDWLSEFTGNASKSNVPVSVSNTSTANGNFANFENAFNSTEKSGWTSFEDDLYPLSPSTSLGKDPLSRVYSSSSAMPRPLSLPTFAPTNPFHPPPSTTTPTQWPSLAAPPPTQPPHLPSSASLDAYPMQTRHNPPPPLSQVPQGHLPPPQSRPPPQLSQVPPQSHLPPPPQGQLPPAQGQLPAVQSHQGGAFGPPPTAKAPAPSFSSQQQGGNTDRYAALADLDSLFHQPVTPKVPSWTVDTTSSSGSLHEVPAASTKSAAPSNPFATSTELWNQPPPPAKSSFQSANPFQTGNDSLSYSQPPSSQPFTPFQIPMVGNSPSEDSVRNQFNANFSPFPVTSPTNGYGGANSLLHQNGSGVASPPAGMWNMPTNLPMWSSSQTGLGGLFSNENKPPEPAQHADWIQNPVNPFTVPANSAGFPVAPKNNCSNPFL